MLKNNLTILKLGGSVITRKKEGRKKINRKALERISFEIAKAKKKKNFSLIIVHGVGSFGHIIAKKFNLNEGYKNKAQILAVTELYCDLKELPHLMCPTPIYLKGVGHLQTCKLSYRNFNIAFCRRRHSRMLSSEMRANPNLYIV